MKIPSIVLHKVMNRAGDNPKAQRATVRSIYCAFCGETVKPYCQKLLKEHVCLNNNGVEELSMSSVTECINDLGNPVH